MGEDPLPPTGPPPSTLVELRIDDLSLDVHRTFCLRSLGLLKKNHDNTCHSPRTLVILPYVIRNEFFSFLSIFFYLF